MDKRVLLTVVICMGDPVRWIVVLRHAAVADRRTRRRRNSAGEPQRADAGGRRRRAERAPSATARRRMAKSPQPRARPRPRPPRRRREAKPERGCRTVERPELLPRRLHHAGARRRASGSCSTSSIKKTVARDEQEGRCARSIWCARAGANLPLIGDLPAVGLQRSPADAAWTQLPATRRRAGLRLGGRARPRREALHVRAAAATRSSSSSPSRTGATSRSREHLQLVRCHGWQDPNVKPGGMFCQRVIQTEGVCDVNGKLKRGRSRRRCSRSARRRDRRGALDRRRREILRRRGGAQARHRRDARCTRRRDRRRHHRRQLLTAGAHGRAARQDSSTSWPRFLGPEAARRSSTTVKVGGVDAKPGRRGQLRLDRGDRAPDAGGAQGDPRRGSRTGASPSSCSPSCSRRITWWPTHASR